MKRFVAAILVMLLLFSLTSALAAAPGSATDPLISQSYITNTFAPSVVSEAKKLASSSGSVGGWTELSLSSGKSAILTTGCCFMLTSGSAYLYTLSGTVVDCATGKTLAVDGTVSLNHRYLCAENTTAAFAATGTSTALVEGSYSLGIAPVKAPKPKQVVANTMKVLFNGKEQKIEAYNVDGNTYYKLRDIAALMKGTLSEFSVDYNKDTKQMFTYSPGSYTLVGGELTTGKDKSKSCVVSEWTLQVNGQTVSCYIYNFANNNFFKLRDLGDALGFEVDYDSATRSVIINSLEYSTQGYAQPETAYDSSQYGTSEPSEGIGV